MLVYCRRFRVTFEPAGMAGESSNGVGNLYKLSASMKKPGSRQMQRQIDAAAVVSAKQAVVCECTRGR
jgi:hypothetical protein